MNKYLLTSLATIFMAGTAISQEKPMPVASPDPALPVSADASGSSDGSAATPPGTSGDDGTSATGVAAGSGSSEATATNTSGDDGTSATGVAPEQ